MKNTLFITATAAVVLALGMRAVLTLSRDEDRSSVAPTRQDEPAPSPSSTNVDAAQACRLRVGQTRAWRIEARRAIEIDTAVALGHGAQPGASNTKQTLDAHASLQIEVLTQQAAGAVVLARLWDVDEQTLARTGDLSAPFLLRIGDDCAITAFARYKASRILAARAQQATVQDLWFAMPSSDRDTRDGADSVGQFQATVARADGGLQRRVHAYRRLWDNAAPSTLAIDNSFMTVEQDHKPWFRAAHLTHQFHGGAIIRGETTLSAIEQALSSQAFAQVPRADSEYIWEDLLPRQLDPLPGNQFTAAERAAQAQLATVTPDEALRRLRATVAENKGIQSQWKDLSTYFEARPDKIPEIAEQLLHEKLDPAIRIPAFIALGMARVPQARDALFAMNQDASASLGVREQTVVLLAARKDATNEIASAVRRDAAQHGLQAPPMQARYARTAVLALGMMGDTNRETNPNIKGEAIGLVRELLPRGQSVEHLSPVFGAMGNLGDAELMPEVRQWTAHPDPDVRAIAVKTIRRMPLVQVDGLVNDWLRRETAAGTKRELYTHLRDMTVDQRAEPSAEVVKAGVAELRARPGLITRLALIDLLGPSYDKSAEVREVFLRLLPVEAKDPGGAYQQMASYIPESDRRSALAAGGLY